MADSWESLVRHARNSKSAYITAATRLEVVAMADELDRLRAVNTNLREVMERAVDDLYAALTATAAAEPTTAPAPVGLTDLARQRKTMGEVADELDQLTHGIEGWLGRPTLAATLARLAERLREEATTSSEPPTPAPPPL